MSSNANRWTEEEICKLVKFYSAGGMAAASVALSNRSPTSILSKARDLKIRVINPRSIVATKKKGVWSDEEVKMLMEHYPHMGVAGVKKIMPKRTEGAIARKATAMKLKHQKSDERATIDDEIESFAMNVIQIRRPVGTWKAERPLCRSVFELAVVL